MFNAWSIHNKYVSISQWISDHELSVVGIVESCHDSHDCPDLIACAPTGYSYIDRPRSRIGSSAINLHTNYGGVVLLYSDRLHAREVALPKYKLFVLFFLQCAGFNTLPVVIYRPGSAPAVEGFLTSFQIS